MDHPLHPEAKDRRSFISLAGKSFGLAALAVPSIGALAKEVEAAVARKDQKGFSGEGWHPEEAVTREQALKMFTLWPAYAAFEDTLRGTIEVGKLADLTILSADIMKIPAPEILKTRCVMTVINGEIVHEEKS